MKNHLETSLKTVLSFNYDYNFAVVANGKLETKNKLVNKYALEFNFHLRNWKLLKGTVDVNKH